MKKILLLLTLILGLTCSTEKRDPLREVFFLGLAIGEYNFAVEPQVFSNVERLTGPLGQVEYRGLDQLDNIAFSGIGKYNWQEAGDATLYTGKTMGALAWRYKNTRDPKTLELIGKMLGYFKKIQSLNSGGFGRNFVDINAYNQFPPCNQNGTVGVTPDNQACGTMRYKDYSENGIQYKFRYDFSLDATIHSLVGLYWVYNFIPEFRSDVVSICKNLLDYYEANSFTVKDINGITLRYGNHSPTLNPVGKIDEVILKFIVRGEKPSLGAFESILNIGRTYDGVIVSVEDNNFFNHYMMIKGVMVLVDIGYPLRTGLKNLINEVNNQNNELADAIDLYYFRPFKIHISMKQGFPLFNYHCLADSQFDFVYGLVDRKPYSKWEFSPFRRCIIKKDSELGLNSDFLEAMWLK